MILSIEGYEENAICNHCNRNLKHGIKISNGQIVGANCFDKTLTKPKNYFGKAYRVGASKIIELAKIAEFYSPAYRQSRFGVTQNSLNFESAEK